MTGRKLARFAAMFGLLAGCGGGGGSSKPVTESEFCAQKADAECQVSDDCLTDPTACKTVRMTKCTEFGVAAKQGNERVFKPENIGLCINSTTNAYAKTTAITPQELNDINDACNYVYQGNAGKTEACTVNYDCADKTHICDKGLCAPKVTKNSGELCGNPGEICAAGSSCMMMGATYMCAPKLAMGMTCGATTAPCLEALRCSGGTCLERVALGLACTTNDDCLPAAPYCNHYAQDRCGLGLSFAEGSASCADFGGTSSTGTGGSGGGTGGSGGGTGGGGGGTGGGGGRGGGGGTGGGGGGTTGTGGRAAAAAPAAVAAPTRPSKPSIRKQPAVRADRSPRNSRRIAPLAGFRRAHVR